MERSSHGPDFDESFVEPEAELVGAPSRPKFAELSEEPAYTPLPRDFASDMGNGMHAAETPDHRAHTAPTALFVEPGAEQERDLDVPAFMRRLQF